VPVKLLTYPPSSDTVQLHQDHWCSSQSRGFNTVAVQSNGRHGRTYKAESGNWISYYDRENTEFHKRLRSLYGEDATDISWVRNCVLRFKSGEKDSGDKPDMAAQRRQLRRRAKRKLMRLYGMTAYSSYVFFSPQ